MTRSWSRRSWLPKGTTLHMIGVRVTPARVVVEAAGPTDGRCPACRRRSRSRHSRYWRTLRDLAAQGRAVTLRVRVSRWRCRNGRCPTTIFADRLPGVAAPHAQHTERCGAVVHLVGYALGGRGGERLLSRLGIAASDTTILRRLTRAMPPPPPEALHVVGIDDWAWRKGQHHYGTILVDLERRRVADVLESRTADAVAAWLAAHPSITVISRDRHGPYAQAVRRGAPQATQVADRFHLVVNLRGAVQQALSCLQRWLVVPVGPPVVATPASDRAAGAPRHASSAVVLHQQQIERESRALKLTRFRLVKRLQAAGRSGAAIIRETRVGRASVRKWLRLPALPPRQRMAPRPGMPAFYESYLAQRWRDGCHSVKHLMAEIRPMGYIGNYSGLAKFVAPWREPRPTPPAADEVPTAVVRVRCVSPQVAAALLSQPRPLLTARQAETVDALKQHCPGFTIMRRLVLSFRTLLRHGHVPTLHRWLERASGTNIHALQRFVRTLRKDLSAVEGAVTESWSNGPVEGHINRLKTLRRQMYGRAGVELLRARVLPLPPLSLR